MRRRWIIVLLICASAGTILWSWAAHQPQPSYNGRTLESLIADMDVNTFDNPDRTIRPRQIYQNAEQAIDNIGTNAVPHLIRWAAYKRPRWKRKLYPTVNRMLAVFPTKFHSWDKQDLRAARATVALAKVATISDPVLRLVDRLSVPQPGSDDPYRAQMIMAGLAERSFAGVLLCLTNQSAEIRATGLRRVVHWRTNAHAALPAIVAALKDDDPKVAVGAALALEKLRLEPNLVVPALIEALHDSRAPVRAPVARALGAYRTHAEPALPSLTNALTDPDRNVRFAATNALTAIRPKR